MAGTDDIRATVHVHHNHFFRLNCFLLRGLPKPVTNDHLQLDIGLVGIRLDIPSNQMGGSSGYEDEVWMVLATRELNVRVILMLSAGQCLWHRRC
jgi:hypothetical protein